MKLQSIEKRADDIVAHIRNKKQITETVAERLHTRIEISRLRICEAMMDEVAKLGEKKVTTKEFRAFERKAVQTISKLDKAEKQVDTHVKH